MYVYEQYYLLKTRSEKMKKSDLEKKVEELNKFFQPSNGKYYLRQADGKYSLVYKDYYGNIMRDVLDGFYPIRIIYALISAMLTAQYELERIK